MTVGKTGLLLAGLVAVFAVGVMTGPTIGDNWSRMHPPNATVAAPASRTQRAGTGQGGAACGARQDVGHRAGP